MRFDGKIALVTGAGSGIGQAIAIELSRRGAQLILVGRRATALEQTKALLEHPARATIIPADITDEVSRLQLAGRLAALGRLDLLVNNAGVVAAGPLTLHDSENRRRMIETNLVAPMELAVGLRSLLEAAAPSRILNIGSMFGDIAFPYFSAYSATKFGLRGWSEALRRELASSGIGVTYAAPRGVRTDATDDRMSQAFDMRLDDAAKVARSIVDATLKGRRDIYPRGPERLFMLIQRLFPAVLDGALAGQLKRAAARLALGAAVSILATQAFAPSALASDQAPIKITDPLWGWYVAGKGGPSYSTVGNIHSTGNGTINDGNAKNMIGSFGMSAGYEWMYRYRIPLRTEFEFMNRTEVTYNASPVLLGTSSGALASTLQNVTGMAKAYWYFPVNSPNWWPFISGGVGWSHNTIKSQYSVSNVNAVNNTHTIDDVAWSGGVGATFKLGPKVMNDVEIRYVDLGKANWGMPAGRNIATNGLGGFAATEVNFAIRVMF